MTYINCRTVFISRQEENGKNGEEGAGGMEKKMRGLSKYGPRNS